MSTNPTVSDILALRRYMLRTDEGIKAYKFVNEASKLIDDQKLKDAAELTFKQVSHMFDPTIYKQYYHEGISEQPVPEEWVFNDMMFPDRLRWVKKLLKEQGAKSVLDLGCSEGSYALNICREGYEVTGVNLFKSSIATAKERADKFGLSDRAHFVQSDLLDYDEGKKFDAVMLFEVIEHVPDPEAVVEKMVSLTNKDGVCYISTPDGTADEYASGWSADYPDLRGHVRVYTEETLRELVKDYEVTNFYRSETDSMKLVHIAFRRKNGKKA